MTKEIIKKIIMLGDGAVGKTSLIRKYVEDQFDDNYIFTIGTKVTKKQVNVETDEGEVKVNMVIWDILGQTDYHRTQNEAFKGAAGALVVCDITRKETLENLEKYWIPQFEKTAGKVPIVFIGNKSDLKAQAQFSAAELTDRAQKLASPAKATTFMTSAKTGKNVPNVFENLAMKMVKN